MKIFFHTHEKLLPSGNLILPGRWGATIMKTGNTHPFFEREHILEKWRMMNTSILVSRFNCTFAFENREQAGRYALEANPIEYVHTVIPIDSDAYHARLDMLWITWMSEPGATIDNIVQWCANYWAGRTATDIKPEATSTWEWLFACPLKVI